VGVRIRVRGLEHLPESAAVVVSNHASYVDGVVMTAALPRRYTFVVQDGAEDWPLVGSLARTAKELGLNRSEARAGALLPGIGTLGAPR